MTDGALAEQDLPDAHPGRTTTVLIADDNDHFRAGMVRALLRRPDLELVHAASDGDQALAALRVLRPDVAVVDVRMPVLDGLGLARAVRADRELATTRVVLLSARCDERLGQQARAAGALVVLDKSQSRRAICDAVAAVARSGGAA